jgi:opacity protein-like surface antigen
MLDGVAAGAMIRLSIVSYKSLIMVLPVLLVCVISLLASPATAAARAEEVHLVPAVYVFGDSTVDVGNNQYLPGNSALQLPYGIDFPHSRSTGRFSNGYNVADFVGQ